MNSLRRLGTTVPGAFGFPLGAAIATLVTIGLVGDGATRHPGWAELALGAVVVAVSALTTPGAVLGTAVLSWLLLEGFVVGRDGQVALNPGSVRAAVTLALVAVACVALTTAIRAIVRFRRYRVSDEATASAHNATASST